MAKRVKKDIVDGVETEVEVETFSYTVLGDKAIIDGVMYKKGDTVELTKAQAASHRDRDLRLSADPA